MTTTSKSFITPDWPAPANVNALQSTRIGGTSSAPYATLNFGDHVGDLPDKVQRNRLLLRAMLPGEPLWLKQVHGTRVADADVCEESTPVADASISRRAGRVCVVMTADCLPVLFCDKAGTVVAAAHAGWRGLLDGVLENTIAAMQCPAGQLMAWLGPAIGPGAFEVGDEVRQAFVSRDPAAAAAFTVSNSQDKWLADLYRLARQRIEGCGLNAIYGGGLCTFHDSERYFSYRRDGITGRMASLIWLG